MERSTRLAAAVILLVVIGAGAFSLARQLAPRGDSEATEPEALSVDPEAVVATIEAGKAKARFEGELLGLHIAPSVDRFPPEIQKRESDLIAAGCVNVPAFEGRALDFPKEFNLAGFVAVPPEPQVVACGGILSGVTREYRGTAANGGPATLLVGRGISVGWAIDAAADAVVQTKIGGRDAVLVKPTTPDGTGQTSNVLFPEPFGATVIYAFNLSESELLAIAGVVAEASQ